MNLSIKISIAIALMLVADASLASKLNIYDNPSPKANVAFTMQSGEQLIPIFYTKNKTWVKVANPKDGNVGWAKVEDLKAPLVLTKVKNGAVQQQIIMRQGKNKPQVYSIVQYSGSQQLTPKEIRNITTEIEHSNQEMRKQMLKTQEDMDRMMRDMSQDFSKDRDFYSFPVIQPIIVVPNDTENTTNHQKKETKK